MLLLQDKTAVVYGATGHVGSAIARVFAREGARVFVTGRKPDPLHAPAGEVGPRGVRVLNLSCGSILD